MVDVTDEMVKLFDPDEETLEKIRAVLKHPPVTDSVIDRAEHVSRPVEGEPRAAIDALIRAHRGVA